MHSTCTISHAILLFSTHQILVRQVQLPLGVLLDAEVQRADAGRAGPALVGVALDLQAGTSEAVLRLEDGLVVDSHFDGLGGRVIEARARDVGELQALAELLAAADVVRVERARRVRVEVGRY